MQAAVSTTSTGCPHDYYESIDSSVASSSTTSSSSSSTSPSAAKNSNIEPKRGLEVYDTESAEIVRRKEREYENIEGIDEVKSNDTPVVSNGVVVHDDDDNNDDEDDDVPIEDYSCFEAAQYRNVLNSTKKLDGR